MRPATLLSLGLAFAFASTPLLAEEPEPQPSKESYFKVRVEVEVRGILAVTEKGATISTRSRIYDHAKDSQVIEGGEHVAAYPLDFSRDQSLRELAKALSGKEVVLGGLGELRPVMQQVHRGPGGNTGFAPGGGFGFPMPVMTWSLQRTIEVTRIRLVGEK
jgi:hypothetical protein